MRPTRPPSSLDSADDIEQQFYDALRQGDLDALMALWADDDEIICVHPGGARLVGPAAIRAGFEAMFVHGGLDVQPGNVRRVHAHASAVHSVVEHVRLLMPDGPRSGFVVATNVYLKTLAGWRMVAHHASPGADGEPRELAAEPSAVVLH